MKAIGFRRLDQFILPVALLLFAAGSVARATTFTWVNTAGGNWNVPGNWSPAGVPGSADTADISALGTYTVTVNTAQSVGTLTMSGTSGTQTLNITSGGTLTNNAAGVGNTNAVVSINGGNLTGPGTLTLAGPLNWSGGTIKNTVQCNGGMFTNFDNLDGGQLINSGTLGWAGTIYDGAGSVISNASSGTINMTWNNQTYFTFPNFGAPATFYNAGQLNVAAGLGNTGYIEDTLTNSGTISFQNGTLSLPQTTNLTGGTLNFGITNLNSFGSLKLTGPAILGGTLAAAFEDPSFAPAVNNQWTLITYASFSGAFSTVNLPSIAVWQTTASATSYIIKILQLTSVTVITMNPPVLNSNQVQLNFTVNGPASVFHLLQTGRLGTPWSTNATALFTTNAPGSSYRFTTTKGPSNQFYRVQSP